MKGRLITMIHA